MSVETKSSVEACSAGRSPVILPHLPLREPGDRLSQKQFPHELPLVSSDLAVLWRVRSRRRFRRSGWGR
jgi:hypothetical protein